MILPCRYDVNQLMAPQPRLIPLFSPNFSPRSPRWRATQRSPARKCWEFVARRNSPGRGDTDVAAYTAFGTLFRPIGGLFGEPITSPGLTSWAMFLSRLRRWLW